MALWWKTAEHQGMGCSEWCPLRTSNYICQILFRIQRDLHSKLWKFFSFLYASSPVLERASFKLTISIKFTMTISSCQEYVNASHPRICLRALPWNDLVNPHWGAGESQILCLLFTYDLTVNTDFWATFSPPNLCISIPLRPKFSITSRTL